MPEPATTENDTSGVSIPPPLVYLAAFLLGFGLEALWPVSVYSSKVYPHFGKAIVLAGVFLMIWAGFTFYRHKTSVDYRSPTRTIVQSGPFRLSRNPIYLGLTLICAGMLLPSLWSLVVLPACLLIRRWVIVKEEAYLERKFGEEYDGYKTRVRRWI